MMAEVTLTKVFLNEATDPANYITLYSDGPPDTREIAGDVRAYAGGNLRVITTTVDRQSLTIRFPLVADDELAQLNAWRGQIVCYRDVFRRLLFGTYLAVTATPYVDRSGWSVGLSFRQVTFDIAV